MKEGRKRVEKKKNEEGESIEKKRKVKGKRERIKKMEKRDEESLGIMEKRYIEEENKGKDWKEKNKEGCDVLNRFG